MDQIFTFSVEVTLIAQTGDDVDRARDHAEKAVSNLGGVVEARADSAIGFAENHPTTRAVRELLRERAEA